MPTTYTRAPLAIAAICASVACRDSGKAPDPPPAATVEIVLDDDAPKQVAIDRAIALHAVVTSPAASWLEVIATTRDHRMLELTRPATTYPGAELRLYLEQDRPAIGVFRLPAADMPASVQTIAQQPLVSLAEISQVVVRTRIVALPPITVRASGKDIVITEAQLRTLPFAHATVPRERGWRLADIISLAAPDAKPQRGRLHASGGAITELDAQALLAPHAVLKQNQRGEYVFRMWDNETRGARIEVRGVTKIEVD